VSKPAERRGGYAENHLLFESLWTPFEVTQFVATSFSKA